MVRQAGKQKDKEKHLTRRRDVKVVLRCVVKKVQDGYVSTCLELSLASFGETRQQCELRLKEAVKAYIDVVKENQDSKVVFRKVPFYWFKRMVFEFRYRCYINNIRKENQSSDNFILEQMMPVGI